MNEDLWCAYVNLLAAGVSADECQDCDQDNGLWGHGSQEPGSHSDEHHQRDRLYCSSEACSGC